MAAKKQSPASQALKNIKHVSRAFPQKTVAKSPLSPTYRQLDKLKSVLSDVAAKREESKIKYTTAPNKPGQGPLREYARYSSDTPSLFRTFREIGEMNKLKKKRNRHASETY